MFAAATPSTRRKSHHPRPALATVDGPAATAIPSPLLALARVYVTLSDWVLPLVDSLTHFFNAFQTIIFGPDTRPVHPGDAIVLTGAGSGIGYDAALTLARQGIVVYAGVRKPEDVPRLVSLGIPTLVPVLMDVTSSGSIRLAKQRVEEDLGAGQGQVHLAGIVNVAGIIVSTAMETATLDEVHKAYDVNAFGPLQVTQAFLPLMREHGRGGRIVLVGSVASWATAPHAGVYCSSKRAAEGIFEGLRQELAHEGIHVAIVRPGGVSTAIGGKVDADPVKGQAFAKFAELLMKYVGIPPRNITRHIGHALMAQFPLTTYLGGLDGRFIWFARAILPERVFDLVMIRIMLGHW